MASKEKAPATSSRVASASRGPREQAVHPDLIPIVKMLDYRGYQKVEVLKTSASVGDYHLVLGSGQRYEQHPRPNAQALVLYDTEPGFTSSDVLKTIRILYSEALSHKLSADSSIIYVYKYPVSRVHSAAIERGYTNVLDEYKHEITYYLEEIQTGLFQVDWSLPRVTRNWRLHREDYYVIMYTQKDEPVIVDRPPLVASNSPEIKYIGGRPNEYASFERIESMEVGPMWIVTMRKIGKPVEAKIGETTSEEPGEADEGGLPDR